MNSTWYEEGKEMVMLTLYIIISVYISWRHVIVQQFTKSYFFVYKIHFCCYFIFLCFCTSYFHFDVIYGHELLSDSEDDLQRKLYTLHSKTIWNWNISTKI